MKISSLILCSTFVAVCQIAEVHAADRGRIDQCDLIFLKIYLRRVNYAVSPRTKKEINFVIKDYNYTWRDIEKDIPRLSFDQKCRLALLLSLFVPTEGEYTFRLRTVLFGADAPKIAKALSLLTKEDLNQICSDMNVSTEQIHALADNERAWLVAPQGGRAAGVRAK